VDFHKNGSLYRIEGRAIGQNSVRPANWQSMNPNAHHPNLDKSKLGFSFVSEHFPGL
jgi:hypothetical protein